MDSNQQNPTDIEEQIRQLEEEFNRNKAELEARRQIPPTTGGGATIQGDVTVSGDFVNRDKYEEHHHYHDGEGPATAQQAEAAYRQYLANHCDTLPLRGVDPNPAEGATGRQPLSLAQVYIALDTQRRAPAAVIAQALQCAAQGQWLGLPELSSPAAGRDEDIRALSALEATLVHRNWALLGKPGAGKTTFVNYLTHALAVRAWEHLPGWPEQERDALPIRVILRDFARWLANQQPLASACPELLWGFIAHDLKRCRLDSVTKVVEQALDQPGRAVVFLDGLDEVPPDDERLLALVRDSVTAFAERYHHSRHLVTCRVLSYQEPRWQLPADLFPPLELAPFNDDQIDRFIDAWYTEVGAKWRLLPGDADRLADKLRQAVRRSGLWKLAPNPLLLTVMALVHTHRKELPEKRALLYQDAVDILLEHWEQHKDIETTPPLRDLLAEADRDFNDLKDILERLAFTTLDQAGATPGSEDSADLHEYDLLQELIPLHPRQSYDWAKHVLDTLHLRSSLLLARTGKVFGFPHRTFQEYLAGVHLARLPDFEQVAVQRAEAAAFWREVILLAVGYLVHQNRDLGKPRLLLEELCPDRAPLNDSAWRQVWLAGDVLLEAGFNRIQDSDHGKRLLERVRWRLAELLETGALSARERAEAGDVLGQLGDPRFDPAQFSLPGAYRGQPEPLAGFVEIPPGPFVMGSRKGDKDARQSEFGNPATLTIDYRYWLAHYPVTVAQFQCFIDGGGYDEPEWWTRTGWSWRQGQWDSQVKEEDRWWLEDRLRSRPMELRNSPMQWNVQRAYPNRPVVNVCWFEAMAYCRWLDAQVKAKPILPLPDGYGIRLPTEAEWEKAARCGDARRYPWGVEDWDEMRANISASEIGHPTPVGIYPSGATPTTELHDLSGNVWEWMLSRYRPYPYDPKDGRNDPEAEDWPVVRGGSWLDNQRNARAASRGGDPADLWSGLSGIRVVLSLANSGF